MYSLLNDINLGLIVLNVDTTLSFMNNYMRNFLINNNIKEDSYVNNYMDIIYDEFKKDEKKKYEDLIVNKIDSVSSCKIHIGDNKSMWVKINRIYNKKSMKYVI